MFLLALLTSVLSSEYLVRLLIRSQMLLFLGPEDAYYANYTQEMEVSEPSETNFFIDGSFYLDSSENFESYLIELGVGYFLRQLAMLAFPMVTVKRLQDYENTVLKFIFSGFVNLVHLPFLPAPGVSRLMLL